MVIFQSALKSAIPGSVSIQRLILKSCFYTLRTLFIKSTVIQGRKRPDNCETLIHLYKILEKIIMSPRIYPKYI